MFLVLGQRGLLPQALMYVSSEGSRGSRSSSINSQKDFQR